MPCTHGICVCRDISSLPNATGWITNYRQINQCAKTLTPQTREDNARFFDSLDEVPHHVITQGIGTILEARHLVLLATGAGKAEAVAATVEGPLAALVPASALQLHPHATVVIVVGSSSLVTHRVVGSVAVSLARHSPVALVVVP